MTNRIFLSYRRQDRIITEALVNTLKAHGLHVWWDDDIEGGENWRESIVENLTNSDMMVILFSEAANASKELKKELAVADSMDKVIVPVLIEDIKPKGHYLYELQHRNWIQIHPEPIDKLERLVKKLSAMADRIQAAVAQASTPVISAPDNCPAASPVAARSIPVSGTEPGDDATLVRRNILLRPAPSTPAPSPFAPAAPGAAASPSETRTDSPQALTGRIASIVGGFLRDVPNAFPFRRLDLYVFPVLAVLVAIAAAHLLPKVSPRFTGFHPYPGSQSQIAMAMTEMFGESPDWVGTLAAIFAAFSAAYLIFVFPFRHYQQHVRHRRAAWLLFVSACVPAAILFGIADYLYTGNKKESLFDAIAVLIFLGVFPFFHYATLAINRTIPSPVAPAAPGAAASPSETRTDSPQALTGRIANAAGRFLRDVPNAFPFRRLDLFVFEAFAVFAFVFTHVAFLDFMEADHDWGATIFLFGALYAVYPIFLFPYRYYQQNVRPWRAAWFLGVSACVAAGIVGIAPVLSALGLSPSEKEDARHIAFLVALIAVIAIVLLAGIFYGFLFSQRALRTFRSNVQKL
jgi:hypothetical protein